MFCILPSSFKNSLMELSIINNSYNNGYEINRSLLRYTGCIISNIKCGDKNNIIDSANPYFYLYNFLPNVGHSVSFMNNPYSFFVMVEVLNNIPNINIDIVNKSLHITEDGDCGFVEAVKHIYKIGDDKCIILNNENENENENENGSTERRSVHKSSSSSECNSDASNVNLFNKDTLFYFKNIHSDTFDLITSNIFAKNNAKYNKLLYQIVYALNLQRHGGTFIFKMEEIHSTHSLRLLFILSNIYRQVCLIKPYSSNICYDQIYIVCSGFNKPENNIYDVINALLDDNTSSIDLGIKLPCLFTNKIEHFNSIVGQQKLYSLLYITNHDAKTSCHSEIINKNVRKCIAWCRKYNIPINEYLTGASNIIAYKNVQGII